jgi:PAS domain S-box-containing protein
MKDRWIIPLCLLLSLACFAVFNPSALHADGEKGPQGVVRVGVFPFEPFNFVDQDGMAQGLNADLLREIVKDENWSIRFIAGSWAEGLQRLQNQEIDLMVSVAYSEERGKTMDFTYESVAELWGQVFLRADRPSQNISDLANKRVAIMRKDISGANFIKTAAQLNIHCTIIELPSHADVFAAVQKGEAEAGVAPQHFGLRHAGEYGLVASTIMFSPFSIYFASKKGTQHELLSHIDAHLSRWKKDKNSYLYQRQNYWLANQNGPWKWPSWLTYVSLAGGGAILVFAGFSFFLRKAVVRKTSELQRSVAWHRAILQTAMDGVWVFDRQGRLLEVNQAYCRMTGYSEQELLTMRIADVEANESADDIIARIQTITAQGAARFETQHRRKDASLFMLAISVQPSPVDDGRFIAFLQDITERKQMEEIKAFLARSSMAGSVQPFFNQLAEYLARVLGMDFVCIDRLDPDGLTAHTVAVWSDGHFEDNVSYTLQDTPCGQLASQELCCYPTSVCQFFPKDQVLLDLQAESYVGATLFSHTGEPIGLIAVIGRKPLHNRKVAEDALQLVAVRAAGEMKRLLMEEENKSLQAQLMQSQKMEAIGTLAGGIAHDFNNILSAVLGYAEMARDASPEESPLARDLDKVLEASHRAAALVKQILAFSRQAETERIALQPVPIVKEAIKLLRPTLPSTIVIKQHLETPTRPICADPTQFHQIVMNLCTNAFHAMEQTGGVLDISLEDCELTPSDLQLYPDIQPGNFVLLAIGDTGSGIPPEIKDRIFDPYFTTKGVGKGTGMGLAIVHGIVATAGGFVVCESEPGKGTIFRIYYPAIEQNAVALTQSAASSPTGKEHILLIDDEEMLAEMGQAMLERLGYEVTVRTSSLEALTDFQNQLDRFDAVVTDQTMPGLTGMELAQKMLQIRPDIPIILCTGYSNLVNEEQATHCGITGFVMKPMTKQKIATQLRKALEGKSSV